jgi:hypothetical protein
MSPMGSEKGQQAVVEKRAKRNHVCRKKKGDEFLSFYCTRILRRILRSTCGRHDSDEYGPKTQPMVKNDDRDSLEVSIRSTSRDYVHQMMAQVSC